MHVTETGTRVQRARRAREAEGRLQRDDRRALSVRLSAQEAARRSGTVRPRHRRRRAAPSRRQHEAPVRRRDHRHQRPQELHSCHREGLPFTLFSYYSRFQLFLSFSSTFTGMKHFIKDSVLCAGIPERIREGASRRLQSDRPANSVD